MRSNFNKWAKSRLKNRFEKTKKNKAQKKRRKNLRFTKKYIKIETLNSIYFKLR
jgi:hypothetical protein